MRKTTPLNSLPDAGTEAIAVEGQLTLAGAGFVHFVSQEKALKVAENSKIQTDQGDIRLISKSDVSVAHLSGIEGRNVYITAADLLVFEST